MTRMRTALPSSVTRLAGSNEHRIRLKLPCPVFVIPDDTRLSLRHVPKKMTLVIANGPAKVHAPFLKPGRN